MHTLSSATASFTHAGRRRANQDAVVVRRLGDGSDLVAVADGMGGHAAGEVASRMALEVLIAELETGTPLRDAVAAANTALYTRARERVEWHGMGTTLVVLLRSGSEFRIANVGDSRAYLIDAGTIRQITRDHSFSAEAARAGTMSADEVAASPWRNALTRAIGTDESVEVDVFGPYAVQSQHAVLLCSDGLYRTVPDDVIRAYLMGTTDLPTASQALAALAYRRGSDDNISLAMVEFDLLPRRLPSVTLPLAIQIQTERTPATPVVRPAPRTGGSPAPPLPRSLQRPQTGSRRRKRGSGGRGGRTGIAILMLLVLATLGGVLWWMATQG
ncbi:protein phosphatase 2C domain-containing protein [soil metagenome]|nr:serine/threonine-protein phosphatase [Gemmatimonadota bacterium]